MLKQANFEFYWFSPLGISVILFLGYGLLNLLVGIFLPFLSRRTGTAGFAPQPTFDLILMLWLAFGISQIGLVWFGMRQGQLWAFWFVVAADAAQLAGWIFYGWQTHDFTAPLLWYNLIFLLPAAILGWIGLR